MSMRNMNGLEWQWNERKKALIDYYSFVIWQKKGFYKHKQSLPVKW